MIFDPRLRRLMADAARAVGDGLPDWRTQAERFAAVLGGEA